MGEKRGNTGKLNNPFNENGVLEILVYNKWTRVTPPVFRSWTGKRRITEFTYPYRKPAIMNTYEYEGPIYKYGTNIVSEEISEKDGNIAGSLPPSIKRENENF